MSDKPATATYAEAGELEKAVAKSGLPYGLTHTYAGYSMVREMRQCVQAGSWARYARSLLSICRDG